MGILSLLWTAAVSLYSCFRPIPRSQQYISPHLTTVDVYSAFPAVALGCLFSLALLPFPPVCASSCCPHFPHHWQHTRARTWLFLSGCTQVSASFKSPPAPKQTPGFNCSQIPGWRALAPERGKLLQTKCFEHDSHQTNVIISQAEKPQTLFAAIHQQ